MTNMTTSKVVRIVTRNVGTHFGTVADVYAVKGGRRGRKPLHTTDTKPYGFTVAARESAEGWCEKHGFSY